MRKYAEEGAVVGEMVVGGGERMRDPRQRGSHQRGRKNKSTTEKQATRCLPEDGTSCCYEAHEEYEKIASR
jgi:hypothetical protein